MQFVISSQTLRAAASLAARPRSTSWFEPKPLDLRETLILALRAPQEIKLDSTQELRPSNKTLDFLGTPLMGAASYVLR
jgi:hypothetical protein